MRGLTKWLLVLAVLAAIVGLVDLIRPRFEP